MKKTSLKSLSRNDRECDDRDDYNWGDCLDEAFYLKKGKFLIGYMIVNNNLVSFFVVILFIGCQDPWHVNPNVPLPACTNITLMGWDQQFIDRPYFGERQLARLNIKGKNCKTPCSQTHYSIETSYIPNNRSSTHDKTDKIISHFNLAI